MNTQLFRRHYAITVVVIFFFSVIGYFISTSLVRVAIDHGSEMNHAEADAFFAHLVDDSPIKDRVEAIRHLESIGGFLPVNLEIISEQGENLSHHSVLKFNWNTVIKPQTDYQVVSLDQRSADRGPPLMMGGLVKLPGTPTQFLLITPNFKHPADAHILPPPGPPPGFFGGPGIGGHGPKPGGPGGPPFSLVLITFGTLLTFVLIGIGFALYLIFRSTRQTINLADGVISELHRGNLKARIPITKMDELGLAMSRFNKMAEEIERLVEQLRSVEKSRIILLQDLTHDLRTPVASLKNLLVTIEKKSLETDQAVRAELLSISKKEVDYLERLVEDLLVLAQISEPRYQANQESISVGELLDEAIQSLTVKNASEGKTIEIDSATPAFLTGDKHLLHRLFRNAIENALSFTQSKVLITVTVQSDQSIQIKIRDDGPGFSENALKSFGDRKVSRVMASTQGNRLSVGLGSVIMKTVTEIHSGTLQVRNLSVASGKITGAEVEINIPIS